MRIGIYSPYLDTAGGGEKYVLTIAEFLSQKEDVDLLIDDHLSTFDIPGIISKIEKLHGLNLSKVNTVKAPIGNKKYFFEKLNFLKKYDVLFFNSDGSVFYSTAKKNILHIQLPVINSKNKTLWGKAKLNCWDEIIYNSKFTKEEVEKSWPIKSEVVYPPVDIEKFKVLKKQKIIISVGRFEAHTKVKKHAFLIERFTSLKRKAELKGWSLYLVGGANENDKEYVNELKELAKGEKEIVISPNLSLNELIKLYGEASIYWHAMGYGESNPKLFEHFGITTVEAMASGCVPIVINLGGQREIVEDDKSGLLWNDIEEFERKTLGVIKNEDLREKISKAAKERSEEFGKNKFNQKIAEIVYG